MKNIINDMNDMTKSGFGRLAVDISYIYSSFMYYDFTKSQTYSANGPRCRCIYIYIYSIREVCWVHQQKTVSSVFTNRMDRS